MAPHLAPHLGAQREVGFAGPHLPRHFGAHPPARAGLSPVTNAEAIAIFARSDLFFMVLPYFFGAHLAAHFGAHLAAHFGAHFDLAPHLDADAAGAHLLRHFGAQAAKAETLDKANADVTAIADKIERFLIFKTPQK